LKTPSARLKKKTQKNAKYNHFRIAFQADYENVFSHFYFAQNLSDETITKLLFPFYQTILIFNLGRKVSLTSRQNTQILAGRYPVPD
jgi:hypothetical protein